MKTLTKWLRKLTLVLPPRFWGVPAGLMWVTTLCCVVCLRYILELPPEIYWPLLAALPFATAGFYGLGRSVGFHPIFHSDYRQWLANTPWQAPEGLPFKPIGLVGQDLVVLALIILPVADSYSMRLIVVVTFLAAMAFGWACIHVLTRDFGFAYATTALLLAALALVSLPLLALTFLALAIGVGYAGVQAGLRRFPWSKDEAIYLHQPEENRHKAEPLGWPYGPLLDNRREFLLPWHHACGIGAILTGLALAIGMGLHPLLGARDAVDNIEIVDAIAMLEAYTLAPAIVFRLVAYLRNHASPINLLGRLTSGRLLIPGYDVVFVAPLLAASIALIGSFASAVFLNQQAFIGMAVAYGLAVALLLGIGPSLEAWRYTGKHCLVAGQVKKQTQAPLTRT